MSLNNKIERESEYVRFDALHSALSYALQKTLSKLSLKVLISCYPEIDKTSLEYVRKQIIKSWKTKAESEFQKIFNEKDLENKLNLLDEVIKNAETSKTSLEYDNNSNSDDSKIIGKVDLSALNPSELTKIFIISEKQKTEDDLKDQLKEITESNKKLLEKLSQLRQDIKTDFEEFEPVINELEILDNLVEEEEDKSFRDMVDWAVNEISKSN